MERKLAAILAADVVGYSALMERDEAGTFDRLRARRSDLIEPEIAKHHGRIFKLMGDGLLAEFGSVVEAVECAVTLQRGMRELNASVDDAHRMEMRIGINLGEVIVDGDDRYGEGVNIAARLEQLAEPGGICVSGKVSKEVEKKLAFGFEPMGEQRVKNIAEPIPCFRVTLEASPRAQPGRATAAPSASPGKTGVAVLPFVNMSSDPEQEYFSDGISEDIITDLSKISELHVIARNSSFVYKGRSAAVPDVARELGVRYVLEGSVRKAGNRVRVTGQLVDSTTSGHVWAERFDRDLSDIFAVQDELTQEIVRALKVTLTAKERDRLASRREVSVAAYELYLRGRQQSLLLTRTANIAARGLLEQAVSLEPRFAAALARIAFTLFIDYTNGWSDDGERTLQSGLELARRAVELDESEPDGHIALSVAALVQRDLDKGLAEAERCLALLPNSAEGHFGKARAQIYFGDGAAAIETLAAYMRLDPFYSDFALYILAEAQFLIGEYEEAAAILKRKIERDPQSPTSYALLASCLGHLGHLDECRAAWAEALKLDPEFSLDRQRRVLPYKNPADFERRAEGLRKAGVQA